MGRSGFAALAAMGVLAVGASARAQDAAAQASRRVLLDQAQVAQRAGDHRQALDAAERAGRIEMTPSVRLFIAEEHLALGHLAQAMGSADSCVRDAQTAERVATREVIVARCRELVSELRGRVGFVTVHVAQPAPEGLHVVIAGEPLPAALYNAPAVATPGDVVVEASAPLHAPFRATVHLSAGETRDVELRLSTDARITAAEGDAEGGRAATDGTHHDGGVRFSAGPLVLAGGGVLGFIAAPIFLALRDSAASGCIVAEQIVCPDEGAANRARAAPDFNTAITVSLVAGGALLAGGVLWFAIDNLSHSSTRRSRTTVGAMPAAGGWLFTFGSSL